MNYKAVTILQPWAHLIVHGDKRVENRTWKTDHRGPLYIHAGKSRQHCEGIDTSGMAFGAVVAIANLVDCLYITHIRAGKYAEKYPWLLTHEHTHGPYCWILESVSPIGPWPWKGAQGLFVIDRDKLNRLACKELGIAV